MVADLVAQIRDTRRAVTRDIEDEADRRGLGVYARHLAAEGYNGGYRDALDDVLLVLEGTTPDRMDNRWWQRSKIE